MWPRVDDPSFGHDTNQGVGCTIPFLDDNDFKGIFQFRRIDGIKSKQEVTGELLI